MNLATATRVRMIEALLFFFGLFPTITSAVPALAALVADLQRRYDQIIALSQALDGKGTGIADDKRIDRLALVTTASAVSLAIAALGKANGDMAQYKKFNYSPAKLTKLKDTVLLSTSKLIQNTANPIAADLIPYGIDNADLMTLLTNITAFNAVIAAPRNNTVTHSENLAQMDALVMNTMQMLDTDMNAVIGSMAMNFPAFASQYSKTRKQVSIGNRHTSLRGLVEDTMGSRIVKAQITIVELNRTATTGIDGIYDINTFKPGIYTVLIQADGYTDVRMENVDFKLGKATELFVKMQKLTMQLSKAA